MIWISQIVMDAVKTLACPRGCVKHDAIVKHTKLTGRQVATACTKLVEHQYMTREVYANDTVKPGCYKLTELGKAALEEGIKLTSGPKGPTGKPKVISDTVRDRAWRVLRMRRKTSAPELIGLLLDAGCDDATVTRTKNNLNKYLRYLHLAGYLIEMRREAPQSPTSNGAKRFLLTRNTGPLAPIPQPKQKKVFDQNEEKQYDAKR
jgi:hypothetical protein